MDALRRRVGALSARDRRAMVLGLLVLVPALAWVGLIRPGWSAIEAMRDALVTEQSLLLRERALLREAPGIPERMAEVRLALTRREARLMPSGNPALAEAEIARVVEEAARQSRALLLEVRSVAPGIGDAPPPGLTPIRLNVRVESDFEGVLEFLHALESDPLLIRVVGLSMQSGDSGVVNFTAIIEAYAPREEIT